MITQADWLRILTGLGVKATTAAGWAAPFADEIQPEKFSAGMDDLLAFLPQVMHECALLRRLEENLSYTPERICVVWPGRFPTLASAAPYSHSPQKLANLVYGGRMGNSEAGDGWRFRGRGLLMHTGRAGYRFISDLCGQDFDVLPELLEQPHYALIAALGWWEGTIPDGYLCDQVKVRRRVNGGKIGLEHCEALAEKTREAFA